MSVLLVGDGGSLVVSAAERLISQGDEVRAIGTPAVSEGLATRGVHIARGTELDADLVERAAQNVRTIVVFEASPPLLSTVVEGARAARVDRVVLCASSIAEGSRAVLRGADIEYVILELPRKGLFRKGVPDAALAEAIDAADDMSGRLRLELDLNEAGAWEALRLEVPSRS